LDARGDHRGSNGLKILVLTGRLLLEMEGDPMSRPPHALRLAV